MPDTRPRRTFAVISHPDAGKSTLTEALALHARVITEAGAVHGKGDRRATVSDWMAMEKARGISITSAALPVVLGRDGHIGLLFAAVAVPILSWVLYGSTLGFEIRTVGANPEAARYAGMHPRLLIILTMSIAGFLAGLAGSIEILGQVGHMPAAYATSVGFDAIAVALLGRAVDAVLGPEGRAPTAQSLGGEDFAWYLTRVPGAMGRLGTREPGGPTYDIHQGNLRIDERATALAAKLLATVAIGSV